MRAQVSSTASPIETNFGKSPEALHSVVGMSHLLAHTLDRGQEDGYGTT